MSNKTKVSSSVNLNEIEKFSKIADEWWNPQGKFKPLHEINIPRIEFIKNTIIKNFDIEKQSYPFKGLNILDIGCGGGLASEPMTRLGGDVTGLDASEQNIKVAKLHAKQNNLRINYIHSTIEEYLKYKKKYDVIICMEVIEHVENIEEFISNCCKCLKENGLIFISTLNKTIKSYLFAIIAAEYILRWLPIGTHDWQKFLKPSAIYSFLYKAGVELKEIKGIEYNPFSAQKWQLSSNIDINYILYAQK